MIMTREIAGSHYPTKELGGLVDFFDNRRRPITASQREIGEIPYYGANGVQGYVKDFLFDEPLLLLAEDGGHFGDPARGIAYEITGKAWVNNHAHVLKAKEGVNQRYLLWVLKHYDVTPFISGTTRAKLTKGQATKIPIPMPSSDDQNRIAKILDKADAIRRKREQALTLADDFLKSVFLEMFGVPGWNPKSHPIVDFASLLKIPLRNGRSPSSRGTVAAKVLTLTAITGDCFDSKQEKEGKFLVPISAKDTVSKSDFYICRGNGSPDLIGKGYFSDRDVIGTAFPDTMIAAKPNPKQLTRAYLECLWNGPFVRNQILEAARTTNGTFKINQTAAGAIKIPLPPHDEQVRFQEIVDKVALTNAKLSYGDDLFAALSQRAFNGDL